MPELFEKSGDFVISGEPEAAALMLAEGGAFDGIVKSPALDELDALPFPQWGLVKTRRFGYTSRNKAGLVRAFPMLTSRSCPEHCTYCPHRITASFRSRSVENVIAEIEELSSTFGEPHIVIRDPLFTLDRERCRRIAEEILSRRLKLTFECETRMDDLDRDLIRSLQKAGLREINFGLPGA
jgi:radical SAM superfamily enzyme YgiQ (UPF0313 family)